MSDVETVELVGGVKTLLVENEAMARRINELEAELARRPSDLDQLRAMLGRRHENFKVEEHTDFRGHGLRMTVGGIAGFRPMAIINFTPNGEFYSIGDW